MCRIGSLLRNPSFDICLLIDGESVLHDVHLTVIACEVYSRLETLLR